MKPSVLILITGDPRSSPRPAEAVRIAAGISAWGRLAVHVLLSGAAVQLLGDSGELVDGMQVHRWLPLLAEHGCHVYIQPTLHPESTPRGSTSQAPPAPLDLQYPRRPAMPVEELDVAELAALSARTQYLLRF